MEGHVFRMYDTNSDGNYPFMIILINTENIKNTIYFYGTWIAIFSSNLEHDHEFHQLIHCDLFL